MSKEKKILEDWELRLKELCNFMIDEGFDPDRLRSFIRQELKAQREDLLEKIEEIPEQTWYEPSKIYKELKQLLK